MNLALTVVDMDFHLQTCGCVATPASPSADIENLDPTWASPNDAAAADSAPEPSNSTSAATANSTPEPSSSAASSTSEEPSSSATAAAAEASS